MNSAQDNKTFSSNTLDEVLEITQSLATKSSQGNYIFRGEPQCFEKVSSSLFRAFPSEHAEQPNIQKMQKEVIEEAKKYTAEKDDSEILALLQHFGGKTNLVDFTTDYLVALFFACDGYPEADGRVVMLQKSGVIVNYNIWQPSNPPNRVIAQKSVFVESPYGFVIPDHIIVIPHHCKRHMLEYLQSSHGISTHTIYNDLIGFTKVQNLHSEAYTEFHEGLSYFHEEELDLAIKHYSRALERNPRMANAYNNRGVAHQNKGKTEQAKNDFDNALAIEPNHAEAYGNRGNVNDDLGNLDQAIEDYNKALQFGPDKAPGYLCNLGYLYFKKDDPKKAVEYYTRSLALSANNAPVYYNRGSTWLSMSDWQNARLDLQEARNRGFDIVAAFANEFGDIESFEVKYSLELPSDIAAILT